LWSNDYFFFFFAVFFAFFAFFAFLAMFPSVNPKLNASRQSTGINPSYTKFPKLILHASKKVNAVTTRDRAKASRDAWIQRVLFDQDGKKKCLRGRKTKPTAAKPNNGQDLIG
jgi:hypothetical protein